MKIITHRTFNKAFKKISPKFQEQCYRRIALLLRDKRAIQLNNHALIGKYLGYRSINVTGDYRIIFEEIDAELVKLVNVGTHSQLYGS